MTQIEDSRKYATVIVDISHEKLDKGFQYRIPDTLKDQVFPGVLVEIPFGAGNRFIKGYVIEVSGIALFPADKLKEIHCVLQNGLPIESRMIRLAYWMHKVYGGSMNQALKTVIPVKAKVQEKKNKEIVLNITKEEAEKYLHSIAENRTLKARKKLLEELIRVQRMEKNLAVDKLHISESTIKTLEKTGMIRIDETQVYRTPFQNLKTGEETIHLNEEQQKAVNEICQSHKMVHLLYGITGSGKTEVYMELIEQTRRTGRQSLVLIPEIALTYQTVKRFYTRFGDKVAVIHSRMSAGERYDAFTRAKNQNAQIIIGPRSALFAPFANLGLIVLDEEHESSYKNDGIPKYHAKETAIELAKMCRAKVVLGSATPSVTTYYHVEQGDYELHTLTKRAAADHLASVKVVDLREELKSGNKSIFSRELVKAIRQRIDRHEQTMIFINRRGYAGFVSCRSCGEVIKCPHCDVSLKYHKNGKLVCHYCGYETQMPKICPACGSRYISTFGTGTQKVEALLKAQFPDAKVLRMDMDTTKNKNGHQQILEAFSSGKADILVGTQMIVKGHDFKNVTLVGIIAADLSLNASDYLASERTFQLLTQAAGRAGRGDKPGEVIIQTYSPEHYSITCAKNQDYLAFYQYEIAYRKLSGYPPAGQLLAVLFTDTDKKRLDQVTDTLSQVIREKLKGKNVFVIGPCDAGIAKISDIYRKVLYMKSPEYALLIQAKEELEQAYAKQEGMKNTGVAFDFTPIGNY